MLNGIFEQISPNFASEFFYRANINHKFIQRSIIKMARTKQKFRKTPRGGSLGLEKLNKDSSKDHQTNHDDDEESDEKVPSHTNDNSIIIDTQGAETVARGKVRMSSITTATGTVSSNQSNKSGEKKNHNQNAGKPVAQSLNSQSAPLKAPIKPPVSLATNKPPSSLPVVTNANQGAFVNDRTVYVEGLPFASNEGEVRSFFSECGQILSVRLPTWHDTGRLKGYGHIEFASKDAVAQAFNLDGTIPTISTYSSLHIQI